MAGGVKNFDAGQADRLRAILGGPDRRPAAPGRRAAGPVDTVLVRLTVDLEPLDGDRADTHVVDTYRVADDPAESGGHVLLKKNRRVRVANVTGGTLGSGYYLAGRDPHSGVYVLAGGGADPHVHEFSAGNCAGEIAAHATGTVATQSWGEVTAKNLIAFALPDGYAVDVRKDPKDESGNHTYSISGANVCGLPIEEEGDE